MLPFLRGELLIEDGNVRLTEKAGNRRLGTTCPRQPPRQILDGIGFSETVLDMCVGFMPGRKRRSLAAAHNKRTRGERCRGGGGRQEGRLFGRHAV